MTEQGRPSEAATVVLVREKEPGGPEVFLMRRRRGHSFAAGAYVFPGGRVDPADRRPELAGCVRGNLSAGPAALGLYMAAIRETFEEAGLLPALRADGGGIDPDGADASLFRDKRRLVHDGRMDLAELARTENLVYDLSGLIPWARWITPRVEPKRFDAWFFLALAPPGQTPASDQVEMREALWMRPADAAAEHEAGTIFMMPPTLMILLELAELGSVERMFASGPDRDLRPVLPQAVDDAGRLVLLLPHDPEYSIDGYRQEVRPGRPSRLTLDGGVWRVGRAS